MPVPATPPLHPTTPLRSTTPLRATAPLNPVRAVPARDSLVLDCGTCAVRGDACRGCVVSVLLGPPPEVVDADEARALDVLARSGLVPPLRLVPPADGP